VSSLVRVHLAESARSKEYGLRASLLNVKARLADTAKGERITDRPVYRRITFFDETGKAVADSSAGDLANLYWDPGDAEAETGCNILVHQHQDQRFALVTAGVEYKAHTAGTLVGEVDFSLAFAELVSRASSQGGDAEAFRSLQGHLLLQAADRLKSAVRESDTVAQLGGDEFLILCSDMTANATANRLVETLLAAFEKPFFVQGNEFFVTTSIGVALFPEDGTDSEQLLKSADLALYQAKDAGRAGF